MTYDYATREPNYEDTGITENTRCAYPIGAIPLRPSHADLFRFAEFIDNAKLPCISNSQPTNVIYLTCDAFGVLPPVSLLNSEQAQYWFLSGVRPPSPFDVPELTTSVHLQGHLNPIPSGLTNDLCRLPERRTESPSPRRRSRRASDNPSLSCTRRDTLRCSRRR